MRKLLLILLIIPLFSRATIFYVSLSGNDVTGTGSISQPWRTVTKACNTVISAGNTIHVNAGTYLEAGQMALRPGVTLEGDGITTVVTSSWTTSFFPILDCTSPEGTNGNQEIRFIKFDGRSYASPRGVEVGGRSNVSIHDIAVTNFKEEGVIMEGRQTFDTLPPTIYATGNSFYNNFIYDCSMYSGFGRGCLSIGGQIGILIHDNDIEQPKRTFPEQVGWPIKYYSEGWLKGPKIYNNTLVKASDAESGWNFCVELFNFQGLELYNNTSVGSWDFNFQGDRGSYPWVCYIHDNTIAYPVNTGRIEQALIFEYDVDSAIVEKNIFRNIANGITFYCRPGTLTQGFRIDQNLFDNVTYPASQGNSYMIGGFDAGTNNYTTRGFYVRNNTMIGGTASRSNQGVGLGTCNSGGITNIDIRNNIITNIVYPPFSIGGTATKNNVNISYNNGYTTDQYGIGNGQGVYVQNGNPTNFTNTNYTTVNPQFADSTNYPLKSTSPMRGAGQNVGYGSDEGWKQYSLIVNPIANAGPDQSITLPTSQVIMAGSGTAGTYPIASHTWTQTGGTTVTITTSSSYTTTVTGFAAAGTYTFRLTVVDTMGNTGYDDMTVTVSSGGGIIKQYFIPAVKTIFVNSN